MFNRKLMFHLIKNFKTAWIKVWEGLSSVRQKVLSSLQEWDLIKRNFKEKVPNTVQAILFRAALRTALFVCLAITVTCQR